MFHVAAPSSLSFRVWLNVLLVVFLCWVWVIVSGLELGSLAAKVVEIQRQRLALRPCRCFVASGEPLR